MMNQKTLWARGAKLGVAMLLVVGMAAVSGCYTYGYYYPRHGYYTTGYTTYPYYYSSYNNPYYYDYPGYYNSYSYPYYNNYPGYYSYPSYSVSVGGFWGGGWGGGHHRHWRHR